MAVLVVFLPLLAAAVAGFFGRGSAIAAPSSSPAARCSSRWCWRSRCSARSSLRMRRRWCRSPPGSPPAVSMSNGRCGSTRLSGVMILVVTIVSAMVHVYSIGYMAHDPGDPALHGLSEPLHLLHAGAGDGQRFRAAVFRLGRRRPDVLSLDRLLVRPRIGRRGGDQGLHRQPDRRFRLCARHLRGLRDLWLARLRHRVRQGAGEQSARRSTSSAGRCRH